MGIDIEARVTEAVTNANTECATEQQQMKFCSYEIDVYVYHGVHRTI